MDDSVVLAHEMHLCSVSDYGNDDACDGDSSSNHFEEHLNGKYYIRPTIDYICNLHTALQLSLFIASSLYMNFKIINKHVRLRCTSIFYLVFV